MKIKIGDWKVEMSTLIHLEWDKYYPKLIIHERFEKYVKWVLRLFTILGIGASWIALPPIGSAILSIVLLLIEQFFENSVFEYTTIVIHPLPDFKVDLSQWKTNGFAFTKIIDERYPPYMGPAYADKEYAHKFFNYIRSWNKGNSEDINNLIIISFVIEGNETYTTYIYPNPNRENLTSQFDEVEDKSKLEKYGKRQQRFVAQTLFYNNLEYKETYLIAEFLKRVPINGKFIFVPSICKSDNTTEFLTDIGVLKFQYKIKKRSEVMANEIEYYHLVKK